ncbi:hypothetical protein FB451DRAFT_1182759 [Mycena latifolia]|nr:hypothetical protein FB451DRAFT_1182759 [Mycena latifolia]
MRARTALRVLASLALLSQFAAAAPANRTAVQCASIGACLRNSAALYNETPASSIASVSVAAPAANSPSPSSPPPGASEPKTRRRPSVAAIVGGTLGGLVVVGLAVLCIVG